MSLLRSAIRAIPGVRAVQESLSRNLDNQHERDAFVIGELRKLPQGALLLDAGCGSQRYRRACAHLQYRGQDFAQYTQDATSSLTDGVGGAGGYQYGELDYVGDIWKIEEQDATFDAVLCTEVFEHIPYPVETVREFARLLKSGGKLILTAPSNCLRHMDPYYFYSGFSDRWYQRCLSESGFRIDALHPVGDYYSWLSVELARTASRHSVWSKVVLAPAFAYYYSKRKTDVSVATLCMGYHVVATKL